MTSIEALSRTHPAAGGQALSGSMLGCIEACRECAAACNVCADACLAEPKIDMLRRCIALDMDCADICGAAARVLMRQSDGDRDVTRGIIDAARAVAGACAQECEGHGEMHAHCRLCAEACRLCEEACTTALEG